RVDGEGPGVAIGAEAAEDRVREAPLLADVLEQPRAHRSAEQRIEHVAGEAVLVVLRVAADTEAHVALLELLVPDEDVRHHARRLLARSIAAGFEAAETLEDEIPDALVLE